MKYIINMKQSYQYHFYVIPYIENHNDEKYCYGYNEQPENLEHLLSTTLLENQYECKHLCMKCAFYAQLWYNELILEKKVFTYSSLSKFGFHQIGISDKYKNISHPTLQFVSYEKVKSVLQTYSSKRAYKSMDIKAYDTTIEVLTWICEMYEKYKILIFYEEYF